MMRTSLNGMCVVTFTTVILFRRSSTLRNSSLRNDRQKLRLSGELKAGLIQFGLVHRPVTTASSLPRRSSVTGSLQVGGACRSVAGWVFSIVGSPNEQSGAFADDYTWQWSGECLMRARLEQLQVSNAVASLKRYTDAFHCAQPSKLRNKIRQLEASATKSPM